MEPQLEWVIRELLPGGGTCVDCGANCGLIGVLARRLRGARVLFLEPHPRLAADVRRNIQLNQWEETCALIEAAASDGEGEATLLESVAYDGSHSLLADWVQDTQAHPQIRVPLTTLKSILQKQPGFERVDLLKVDTEGHDDAVLPGLDLAEWHPDVVFTETFAAQEAAKAALLQEHGYQLRATVDTNTLWTATAAPQNPSPEHPGGG